MAASTVRAFSSDPECGAWQQLGETVPCYEYEPASGEDMILSSTSITCASCGEKRTFAALSTSKNAPTSFRAWSVKVRTALEPTFPILLE